MLTTILELVGAVLLIGAVAVLGLVATPAPWNVAVAAGIGGAGLIGLSALIERRRR